MTTSERVVLREHATAFQQEAARLSRWCRRTYGDLLGFGFSTSLADRLLRLRVSEARRLYAAARALTAEAHRQQNKETPPVEDKT